MRPQSWRRAMTDERPLRNEMACPKDFNSAVTDKTHAPIGADERSIARNSPRVRAGGLPFGTHGSKPQPAQFPLLVERLFTPS